VDEVYLESLAVLGRPSGSAAHLGPEFVVTSSLTKAYGLSGLRCGWAVADPDLARRMWRLNDLFGVIPAHPAERLSVVALDHLERIAARARAILETNTDGANAFLAARPDLACAPVDGGDVFPASSAATWNRSAGGCGSGTRRRSCRAAFSGPPAISASPWAALPRPSRGASRGWPGRWTTPGSPERLERARSFPLTFPGGRC
jgi:hypothetical protein